MDQQKPLRDNFKTKQRKAVLRLVALLLVVVTLISVATWSWFTDPNQETTAEGLVISMKSPDMLEMSIDNGQTFRTTLILSDAVYVPEEGNVYYSDTLKDLNFVPLTGKGYYIGTDTFPNDDHPDAIDNFLYKPELSYGKDTNGFDIANPVTGEDVDWAPAIADVDYIDLKIIFRTTKESDIYLGSGTSVITWSEENGYDLEGPNSGNVNSEGQFSRDCIVGALRMSAAVPAEGNDFDSLRFIWIPRPDVYWDKETRTLETGLDSSQWVKKTDTHAFHSYDGTTASDEKTESAGLLLYDFDSSDSKVVTSNSEFVAPDDKDNAYHGYLGRTVKVESNTAVEATTMTEESTTDDQKTYYTCTAYIRIWIDGCDNEAVRAFVNGQFRFNLKFYAIEVPQNTSSGETEETTTEAMQETSSEAP